MKRATYGEPTLDLFPDEVDVELPLDEVMEDPATLAEVELRTALYDVLDALENGRPVPGNRLRHYRTLVGRPAVVDEAATPEARRDDGIARAAAKWTDEEAALVDTAIADLARWAHMCALDGKPLVRELDLREFTTADVWVKLAGTVPITKGIAGRMLAAKGAGLIANTGRTVIAPRESIGPNHGQRLTVWRAL
jgi:hypothetical protein